MGALPSRETHQRGLYSHRHGRNRRSEILLIPLVSDFFASPESALFQHLYRARYRRTAKYYYRALRSAETAPASDYFCKSAELSEPELFAAFQQERREQEENETQEKNEKNGKNNKNNKKMNETNKEEDPDADGKKSEKNGKKKGQKASPNGNERGAEAEGHRRRPPLVDDGDYQSFTDTPEGLYHILIRENDMCLYDTDEALREAYARQVKHQRRAWERLGKRGKQNLANPASDPINCHQTNNTNHHNHKNNNKNNNNNNNNNNVEMSGLPCSFENVSFDAFLSGYAAARQYAKGKRLHTSVNLAVSDGEAEWEEKPNHSSPNTEKGDLHRGNSKKSKKKYYRHITSPAAYYIHPIPCAIASRWDSNKPPPVDDPHYVLFEGFYVKIMGMFGTFPSTVVFQTEHAEDNEESEAVRGEKGEEIDANGNVLSTTHFTRPYPRKEGNPGGNSEDAWSRGGNSDKHKSNAARKNARCLHDDDDDDNDDDDDDDDDEEDYIASCVDREHEQYLLKGTMFIDKDVGDQILGNMVMLATHMYVRQCVRARIQPRYLPMMPFFMRFPLSNIPMLQFIREFRVRLRTLLEAGTAKSGQKPMHVGMSGFNPMDIAETHNPYKAKLEEEGYLFEDDIPDVLSDMSALFMDAEAARAVSFTSHRTAINTNENGRFPIFMLSGFNVQNTPLRYPVLSETGYVPAFTQHAEHPPLPQSHRGSASSCGGGGLPPPPFPTPFSGNHHNSNNNNNNNKQNRNGSPVAPSSPISPTGPLVQTSTVASEAHKTMLLARRKNRFRLWIEDGHVCLWASAAYTRRACLILAQQLNTTVDSHSVPEQRSWLLRGLLHRNAPVPAPQTMNDVLVVAEDVQSAGLWQGDVLRCCTAEELRAMQHQQPLPLPCRSGAEGNVSTSAHGGRASLNLPGSPTASQHSATSPTAPVATSVSSGSSATGPGAIGSTFPNNNNNNSNNNNNNSGSGGFGGVGLEHPFLEVSGTQSHPITSSTSAHINFTSNHPSNPLLQEQQRAPANAFWVRAAGGLDDSYTNISESNMAPNPKMAKQLQQAAQQRAKKLAAAAAALARLHAGTRGGGIGTLPAPDHSTSGHSTRKNSTNNNNNNNNALSLPVGSGIDTANAAAASLALSMASDFLEVDRREGTLNLEEVVLSWVRVVSMLSREGSSEADGDWVRDPAGNPVRIDRFVFRRFEFEGVRFFMGVTPRFVGQQRRIEKVLGEVYALEQRTLKEEAAAGGFGGLETSPSPLFGSLHPSLSKRLSTSSASSPPPLLQQQRRGESNADSGSFFGAIGAESSQSQPPRNAKQKSSPTGKNKDVIPTTTTPTTTTAAAVVKEAAGHAEPQPPAGNEDEYYNDVLERMGFDTGNLREAFEHANRDNGDNNDDTDRKNTTAPPLTSTSAAACHEEGEEAYASMTRKEIADLLSGPF